MSGEHVFKKLLIYIIFILTAVFLFSGCNPLSYRNRGAKEEEKKIFGFVNGYNHRIKEAQGYLVKAGFNPGPIDGKAHRDTRKAIKGFQKKNNLRISGFIDSGTWTRLSRYKRKDESEITPGKIQIALKKAGFYKGPIDDKIGGDTKKAIAQFQKANGLKPDGIVGRKTWSKLSRFADQAY